MDAVVHVKMDVGELDVIRKALEVFRLAENEIVRGGEEKPARRQEARANVVRASELLLRLGVS